LLQCMSPLLAQSGQPNRTRLCPLLDNSGQNVRNEERINVRNDNVDTKKTNAN